MNPRAKLFLGFGTILAVLLLFAFIRSIDSGKNAADSQQTVSNDDQSSFDTTAAGGNGDETATDRNGMAGESANPDSQKSGDVFGATGPVIVQALPEGRFKSELLKLDDTARDRAQRALGELQVPFKDLASLHVDPNGALFYGCTLGDGHDPAPGSPAAEKVRDSEVTGSPAPSIEGSVGADTPPVYHSRPGSQNRIYLDFNGHMVTGTAWNTGAGSAPAYDCLPFNTDNEPLTFGVGELEKIRLIWERVADSFRSFDVDVTTEEPAVFDNRTARVLVTYNRDANGVLLPVAGTSYGVAYVSVFGNSDYAEKYAVSLIYYFYQSPEEIASTIAHELGHNLGLSHDGDATHEYYRGHPYGFDWWSPFMGSGPGTVQQWSKGEYYGANNAQDDLAIIAGRLAYVPDDYSSVAASASPMIADGATVRAWGAIERTFDSDIFSLSVASGPASFRISPVQLSPQLAQQNLRSLEVAAELRDSSGNLVARVDPAFSPGLKIDATLAAGDYTLRVEGVGFGMPLSGNTTGFTSYGSLGGYSVTGTFAPTAVPHQPVVARHPQSADVRHGSDVSFEAFAEGNPAVAYKWQGSSDQGASWSDLVDGDEVMGTGERVLILKAVSAVLDGSMYRCVATNSAGAGTSNPAALRVRSAPVIVTPPVPKYVASGEAVTFSVVVAGSLPMSFQWRKGGVDIPAATQSSLLIPAAAGADEGAYSVVITNRYGSVVGGPVSLGVDEAPQIVTHPESLGLEVGGVLNLSIAATGTPPLQYQWRKDGVPIGGATNSNFSIPTAAEGDSGAYSVAVSNAFGSVNSTPATVVVGNAPTILTQPEPRVVLSGSALSLTVSVQGTAPIAFQWRKNGALIAGATGAVLDLGAASIVHEGIYSVEVSNPIGVVVSETASVTVNAPPKITVQPAPQVTVAGASASFTVAASGKPTPMLQWFRNGVAVDGATNAMLVISDVSDGDAGDYHAVAVNSVGSAESLHASLTVYPVVPISGTRVAGGGYHTLFITTDGTLWGMGENDSGQLGDGTLETRLEPVEIAHGVVSVAAGVYHSLFLKGDGTLYAMGRNYRGELGDGTSTARKVPVQVALDVAAISAGDRHSLFLKTNGTLWGMGDGSSGQLGNGASWGGMMPVELASGVKTMSAANDQTLFVKLDGTAWAMGYNSNGQLGTGSTESSFVPIQVATGIASVEAGDSHSFFLTVDGGLLGAGRNQEGQLGIGTQDTQLVPILVATDVVSMSAGGFSSAFVKADGSLWTMGQEWNGVLGRTGRSDLPGLVAEQVLEASVGSRHMIFLALDEGIWTNGGNAWGQLGDGLTTERLVPLRIRPPSPPVVTWQPTDEYGRTGSHVRISTDVIGHQPISYQWFKDGIEIPGATSKDYVVVSMSEGDIGDYSVVASNPWGQVESREAQLRWMNPVPIATKSVAVGYYCTLFIRSDGSAWGTGVLGDQDTGLPRMLMGGVAAVATGDSHGLLLKSDGTLFAVGDNKYGQLGDGTRVSRDDPVQLATGVAAVAASGIKGAFIKTDGTLWTWGVSTPTGDVPTQVATGATALDSGLTNTLFLRADGAVWGFGFVAPHFDMANAGSVERPILLEPDVKEVATGGSNTFFIKADGSLYAVGENNQGELGDGTKEARRTPVLISTEVAHASFGHVFGVFVKQDGSLWGMGSNQHGQLGRSDMPSTLLPVLLATDVAEVATAGSQTIYRSKSGGVWATGYNASGQLGDGTNRSFFEFYRIDPPGAPRLTVRPVKEYGRAGGTAMFRVRPDGRGPFYYQWRKNGSPIPGANASTLTLTNVTSSDFGLYSVDVSSEFGATSSEVFEFVSIPPLTPKVQALSLGNLHSLFVKGGGSLWAMGDNTGGQLGTGDNLSASSPIKVMDGVVSVAAGAGHNLIIKNDRSLWVSGYNGYGQLGDGTTINRAAPVKLTDHVALVAAGEGHSLFVTEDSTLWAMGRNSSGQLGDGTYEGRKVPVPISTGVVAIAGGTYTSYFARLDGTLWKMGDRSVEYGIREWELPKQIASGGVVDVAAGFDFAVFLKSDGSMWAYGPYVSEWFPEAAPAETGAPFKVAENVVKIASGPGHILFVKTDGTLWVVGNNNDGQLGIGNNPPPEAPVQIATGVATVAASYANGGFIKQDGTIWLMGDNGYGQLGNGTTLDSWIPVQSATINELRINAQPAPKAVVQGQSATLSVSVAAFPAPTYQWLKDGVPIPGATWPTLTIANTSATDAAKYSVIVTNSTGSITSSVASLFVTPDPSTSRMINISTRAFAGSGGDTLTVGFTIVGTGQKTLVIRGVGPKLADFNVPVVVADPKLRLFKVDGTMIAENDDWESVVAANAGGFSLPAGSKDAALEMQLPPGGYTVQLINPGPLAEGMIEVYDISQDVGSRLVNLSCRMNLEPGQIVIVGTALTGLARPVVVRNSGPGLAQYLTDPEKPNAASDPVLHSFDRDGMLVGQNDDWDAELAPYFSVIGAFPLGNGSKDASQRIMITPGLNTVHATAKGEGGIVLIELYESP